MTKLLPARTGSAADWLSQGPASPPVLVGTFVPDSFPVVVRVLNPFYGAAGQRLRWSGVAAEVGLELSRAVVGERLCLDYEVKTGERIDVDFGTVDSEVAAALASVLAEHTDTPDECYFAVWIGYSGIRNELVQAPVVSLPPDREMYLLQGAN